MNEKSEQMIFHADSFFNSAQTILPLPIKNGILPPSTVPCIVLISFACEIYIKSFLPSKTKWVRDHSLEKYFKMLGEVHQKEIKEILSDNTFDKKLSDIANAFKDWRYIYEFSGDLNTINLGFLYNFAEALKQAAHRAIR